MPKAYSADMRGRVIAEVEGGASRREAAEEFEVSASTAIIWVKCFRETGRCAAKARGGSISPLDKHADFLLGLIEKQPDLTLDEVVLLMRKHKIPGSRTAVWRFFQRHKITFKKACARRSKSARMWRGHAGAGCENRACLILRTLCSSTKPPPIPRWCG
jgi:transposase